MPVRCNELSPHRIRIRGRIVGRLPVLVASPAAGAGTTDQAVIVGAGPAGDAVAAGLRDAGFDGRIVLVGAEHDAPYERPHLSKGFLLGTVPRDRLRLRPPDQYRELGVELVLGERVVELRLEEEDAPTLGIMRLADEGGAFDWLADEPDLYSVDDLKVRYR